MVEAAVIDEIEVRKDLKLILGMDEEFITD